MKPLQAISAMARNRVIGKEDGLPWHIPEELEWLKSKVDGGVLVMGRKTWSTTPKRFKRQEHVIVSRQQLPDATGPVIDSLHRLAEMYGGDPRTVWVFGGAAIYNLALPYCSDLFLTTIKLEPEGDAWFPPFEDRFQLHETIRDTELYTIDHYRNPTPEQLG